MFALAWLSVRQRFGATTATFLNLFLGGAILVGFASLYSTGSAAGASPADRQTLTTMSLVIGGWGLLIVAFGVASTLNLTVRQRTTEIALLKSAGATPKQIGRLVRGETALLCLLAAVPAVAVGYLAGQLMVDALKSTHQISQSLGYHFGGYPIAAGLTDTVVAAFIAAWFATRRAARLTAVEALTSAGVAARRISRKQLVFALIFLLLGADCAVLTVTVLKNHGFVTMSVAGEGCIQSAIGLALLAPVLMRFAVRLLGPVLGLSGGLSGYLAGAGARQRTSQSAGLLMPVILFVSLATGALYIQIILNTANAAHHIAESANDKGVATLSFVVVVILAAFAAVVVASIAVTTTIARKREFGQQRLIGATPREVRRTVMLESLVTIVAGLVFGTLSAAIGVIPYSIAELHRVVPDVNAGVYLAVAAAVVVLVQAANLGATRRVLQGQALTVVTSVAG